MNDRDPFDQLAALRLDVDEAVREAHLGAITAALPPGGSRRARRWPLAVVVATLIAGPVTAIASESSAPGDLLYPLKLIIEPIVAIFDRDVAAHHRVDEVRQLIVRDRDDELIVDSIEEARAELAVVDSPGAEQELDKLVSDWMTDRAARDRLTPSADGASERDADEPVTPGAEHRDRVDGETDGPPRTEPAGDAPRTSVTDPRETTTTTVPLSDRPRDGDGAERPPP